MEHDDDDDTNCNLGARNDHQLPGKMTGRVGNRRTSQDNLNDSILKIDQNTEKSPGHLS